MTLPIEIRDTEHGVVLSSTDFELIDHLDDFLTEECYVHFDLRDKPEPASSALPGESRGPGEAHEPLLMNLGPGLRREERGGAGCT
jgi:hypothetical protein